MDDHVNGEKIWVNAWVPMVNATALVIVNDGFWWLVMASYWRLLVNNGENGQSVVVDAYMMINDSLDTANDSFLMVDDGYWVLVSA